MSAYRNMILCIVIHLLVSLFLTLISDLDQIGFIGVYFSLLLLLWIGNKALHALYDTYLGVLLGHNVNLRQCGRWAVVTGATDGIGFAYAKQLAAKGLDIVLISRSLDKLQSCAKLISNKYSVETKIIQIDFSSPGPNYEKLLEIELSNLEIGILINNVGCTYESPEYFHIIASPNTEFIYKMINLNVMAVTLMTRAVLPGMLDRSKGVIINVGSFVSLHGAPFFSLYSATKSYMQTLTLDLAREYQEKGIIFQYQSPGYVTTKIAKIKNPSLFIPTPSAYVRVALESIGLQQKSSIWLPQRIIVLGLNILHMVFPVYYDQTMGTTAKAFWLFAKKRQMIKAQGYNNPNVV